ILKSIGMTDSGVNIVSCPTCGRTRVGLIDLAKEVEQKLSNVKAKLNVAVMGCVVNGPGEAREADVGVACGKGEGLIFAKGEIIKKVPEDQIVPELIKYIEDLTGEKI
ncbi:MAG: flavodoxin-dependent (E)-4-hydroxy-3-methylbut-2-enyl-diphosphate synthase, partial [Clostridia bacterium]|nr:flavodoxin-dependent (E)-4-hydroxy-3-methylbut-2-enyl-diphosphate synthase [Clostridia bacterium]